MLALGFGFPWLQSQEKMSVVLPCLCHLFSAPLANYFLNLLLIYLFLFN